jgi:signal transduction histidine kinase
MKIQTQARLLVTGILLAPLLIVFTNIVDRQFFNNRDMSGIPTYEEISAMLNEDINAGDWEAFSRFISHSRNMGETTIFRDDFMVLYSTNNEFIYGTAADREKIMSLIEEKNNEYHYIFSSRRLNENRIFILNRIIPRQSGPGIPPFFAIVFIFIIILTIFAICMSIIIARTITNSIRVLENNTRRIAEGELDLNIDMKGSNEITSLTNYLNKMRNALKEEEMRRTRFIMGISHDLKTPLALIKGYAEAIQDGITKEKDAAEIIIGKTDLLEGMINDLISYVRLETGEWREKLVEVNITGFLKRMTNTISMDVELLHHQFVSDINLPENLSIHMDEKLAGRAFENLINNAIRHTPNGSTIRFTAGLVKDTIEITVVDNGLGIEKTDLPYIFDMFYKGSSSRREQGIGLGLAVVKWVMDYHGWSISVKSDKENGAVFTITIPLK